MKRKILLAAMLALCMCSSACAPRSTNNDTSSNSKTESDKSDSQSVADGEVLETEQSESDVSSEKTKSVIMGIAGNNAQGIDVKIDIPENWDVGVEEITEDGHFIARFGIASKCTSDADEAIDIILAAEEGSDVVIKEIDGAKNIVKYCKTKVKMYTGHDGWITISELDGVRYSFGSGKLVCDIFFAAEEGADLDQERAKFEACLKTLEIIS